MANEIYLQQIMRYFQRNFIDDRSATEDDLTNLIREKLALIEKQEDRKNLVARTLEEIRDLTLIHKYRQIYNLQQNNQIALPKMGAHIVQRLTYNFRRMI